MKLSVIVPTYNRRDLLAATLESLLAQRFPSDSYEVVVAVDGSTDETRALLEGWRDPRIVSTIGPNRGPAAARNRALTLATGELILFLDDDIVCPPNLLAVHAAAHARAGVPPCLVFGPILVDARSRPGLATTWTRRYSRDYIARLNRDGAPSGELDAYVDANSSVPRAVLMTVGGFDERFHRQGETADLGQRLWKARVRFVWEPLAVVHHVFAKSVEEVVRVDAFWMGRNEPLLAEKHPDLRTRSALALTGEGSLLKRRAREALVRLPFWPDRLLSVPTRVAEWLGAEDTGIALLRARQGATFYRAAAATVGGWGPLWRDYGRRLPALLYHYVGRPPTGLSTSLVVTPERFSRQIAMLSRRGYVGIRASEWLAWLREGASLPERPILLTFDEAYASLDDWAMPVLRRYDWGATVFAVSSRVGAVNDWDRVPVPLASAAQLRAWASDGIEVGAHGRSHRSLIGLSASDLDGETAGSRSDLESMIGAPVTSFAYPFGHIDGAAVASARASFGLAFTTAEGTAWLGDDPHRLPRSMVQAADTSLDLLLRVVLGYSPLEHVRAAIGRSRHPG